MKTRRIGDCIDVTINLVISKSINYWKKHKTTFLNNSQKVLNFAFELLEIEIITQSKIWKLSKRTIWKYMLDYQKLKENF